MKLDLRVVEAALDERHEVGVSAPPRDLDQLGLAERGAGHRQHALLDVAPKMRLHGVVPVDEHVATSLRHDVVAPARDIRGRIVRVERRKHLHRADIRRHGALVEGCARALVVRSRALVTEGPPDLRHAPGAARVPEGRPVRSRGDPVGVAHAAPVEDKVDEAAIVQLHPAAELEKAVHPLARHGQVRAIPQIAPEDDRARDVVHAGDTLDAALAGTEMLACVVGVDRETERPTALELEWSGEGREPVQHGSRLSRISCTSKSAAAITESAAP
jgi:hypothetical protein